MDKSHFLLHSHSTVRSSRTRRGRSLCYLVSTQWQSEIMFFTPNRIVTSAVLWLLLNQARLQQREDSSYLSSAWLIASTQFGSPSSCGPTFNDAKCEGCIHIANTFHVLDQPTKTICGTGAMVCVRSAESQ